MKEFARDDAWTANLAEASGKRGKARRDDECNDTQFTKRLSAKLTKLNASWPSLFMVRSYLARLLTM